MYHQISLSSKASQVSGGTLLGDIALTEEQVDQMLAAVDGIAIQSSALVSGFRFRRWPNTIPYVIDTSAFSKCGIDVFHALYGCDQ